MKVLVLSLVLCVPSILGHPFIKDADLCEEINCVIANNCRCSSTVSPYTGEEPAPQLIALTISESIVGTLYTSYLEPLLFERTNPDGALIGATFYVNHEYTDYQLVQNLWLRGFEIGSHSITKNTSQAYWRNATLEDLVEEFDGQRQILSTFANIPIEDIIGARTPQLQLEGDVSIDAYTQSGITYDNSWPTITTRRLFPYTLDYKSGQQCTVTMACPVNSHPGFWVAPITDITGADDIECNSLATCNVEGTAEEIAAWLMGEVNKIRDGSRCPLILRLDSYWFQYTANSFEAFSLFMDQMAGVTDTFFVSVKEILDWTKNPVSAAEFRTAIYERDAACSPITCPLTNEDGEVRYMTSCVTCPDVYPWKGNPSGDATK